MGMKDKKQKFIGKYITENIGEHGLPYGFQYFNLLDKLEKEAKKKYKKNNSI